MHLIFISALFYICCLLSSNPDSNPQARLENSVMPMQSEDKLSCIWKTKEIQKPDEYLDQNYWKKIFIASCLCALLVDPLFF